MGPGPEIVWKRGAEEELLKVFSEREDYRPGAGEEFVQELDLALQSLQEFPSLAPVFAPPVRRLIVGRSGFGLFYSIEHRGLIVHALIPLRRSPGFVRTYLRQRFGW